MTGTRQQSSRTSHSSSAAETDGGIEPSTRIVLAVAESAGVEPEALPPLFDAVDPTALDRLVEGAVARSEGGDDALTVSFEYADHRIVVEGSDVDVRPLDAEP